MRNLLGLGVAVVCGYWRPGPSRHGHRGLVLLCARRRPRSSPVEWCNQASPFGGLCACWRWFLLLVASVSRDLVRMRLRWASAFGPFVALFMSSTRRMMACGWGRSPRVELPGVGGFRG